MSDGRVVLLVEDNPAEVMLMREAFDELPTRHDLRVVRDGEEALAFLERRAPHVDAPRPDLVLLDLNVPRFSGQDVVKRIKSDERLRNIPVIVLSTSANPDDVRKALGSHANAYLVKPLGLTEFLGTVAAVDEFWLRRAVTAL